MAAEAVISTAQVGSKGSQSGLSLVVILIGHLQIFGLYFEVFLEGTDIVISKLYSGFLPGSFSEGRKIHYYANFYCCANFSIVLGQNLWGTNCFRRCSLPTLWK